MSDGVTPLATGSHLTQHPLSCQCGSLCGTVELSGPVSRGICYCRDCQAFARWLGNPGGMMDAQGGTDVSPTLAQRVQFTQGQEHLACMRLTDHGLVRWYASCCRTPIGNTMPNFRISFVGLIHSCLRSADASLDASFGPVRMYISTRSALGTVRPKEKLALAGIARLGWDLARARLTGTYRQTAFFDSSGVPIAVPTVLTAEELTLYKIPL